MSFRKLGAWAFLGLLILGAIPFVSHNASATAPTITNYGVIPPYGDVGSLNVYTFFLTYTDADNQSPDAGYPKGYGYTGVAWPAFAFVANDSGDTNYADGKAYKYDYYNYPLIGLKLFRFDVKSNGEAVVWKWPITLNVHIPATGLPFHLYPEGTNEPGEKVFTFNYTSVWGYVPIGINITIDGVSHTMTENSSDTEYRDGKDYYYETNLSAGFHNYSFEWTETSYAYPEKTTGTQWILLEDEPGFQISFGAIMLVGLILFAMLILWVKR